MVQYSEANCLMDLWLLSDALIVRRNKVSKNFVKKWNFLGGCITGILSD
jgi:hypothetical protein